MRRNLKIYTHLLFSFALVPAYIYGGAAVKTILLIYPLALILSKDAAYLPALIVLASYMTNSYPLYLAIIGLSVFNYKTIREFKCHGLLLILLLLLPLVFYNFYVQFYIFGNSPGPALNQFQFYLSLFAFFYGILISQTFDDKVIRAICISLFLLFFANLITREFADVNTIRLVFFILPFFFTTFVYLIFSTIKSRIASVLITSISLTILLVSAFRATTFTILSLIIFSIILVILYFSNRNHIALKLTGAWTLFALFMVVVLAISNNDKTQLNARQLISMEEVESFDEFSTRFRDKYTQDRGSLWAGAWQQIKDEVNWLPPLYVNNIFINQGRTKSIEYEFHSHNTYLEVIRTSGIIMGFIMSLVLITFIIKGRKILEIEQLNPYFIVLVAVSIGGLIIGSVAGIYPLLSSYAICGLSIPGVAYRKYLGVIRLSDV